MDSVPAEKKSSIRLFSNLLSRDGNDEPIASRREGTARDKQDMQRIGRVQELNVRVVSFILFHLIYCLYSCLTGDSAIFDSSPSSDLRPC